MRYGNVCVIKETIFNLKLCLINILTISHRISLPPPRLIHVHWGSGSDSGKTMSISRKRLILGTLGSDVLWGQRLPEHVQYFEGQGGFIFRSGVCRDAAGPC